MVEPAAIIPATGVVALRAIMRITKRHVVRIPRPLVIGLMAGIAIGRCADILPVHVTQNATDGRVPSCQRKRRTLMIEGGGLPHRSAVADGAIVREEL